MSFKTSVLIWFSRSRGHVFSYFNAFLSLFFLPQFPLIIYRASSESNKNNLILCISLDLVYLCGYEYTRSTEY